MKYLPSLSNICLNPWSFIIYEEILKAQMLHFQLIHLPDFVYI